jgi:hypothetical protein
MGVRTHDAFFTAGGVSGFTLWKLQKVRCLSVKLSAASKQTTDAIATGTARLMSPLFG